MSISDEIRAFEQVAQAVAPRSRLLRAWPLKGGISAEMTALEIEQPDGRTSRMIVRRPGEVTLTNNPNAAADEFKLLQATKSLGLATPSPYHLDQSGTALPGPYLVIEYIEGRPEFAPSEPADFTRQLATHLAAIHRTDLVRFDLSFLREKASGCAEIAGVRPASVDSPFDEGRIRETLAAARLACQNAPALLHGDYWPGNILWRDGELVAVIDWEDAALGDPLIDFAISRLDVAWIFGRTALDAFTHHYRAHIGLDEADLPYWDLCAVLRLLRLAAPDLAGWVAFFPPFGRPDITEESFRADVGLFVNQALERIAI
jgi:aminoglycoside phosphotransferase (APT) family kinase protein